MKPELKVSAHAYGLIAQGPLMGRSIETSKDLFLSSLHWRGEELWAGPFYFGHVATIKRGAGAQSVWAPAYRALRHAASKPEARAALEAAAKKQINEWFEEQAK